MRACAPVGDPGAGDSDEALCRRVAERDRAAFELLVDRHQEKTYRLAWSILGDAEEARDLSQEAFLRLFEAASSFDGRARFSTWFYRILVNLCLDHRRRHRWWRKIFSSSGAADPGEILEQQVSPTPDPADEAGRRQLVSRLWKAAERLSPQQRAALVLQVQEDLSAAEIAAILKCSEATVRVHVHRAIAALKKTVGSA